MDGQRLDCKSDSKLYRNSKRLMYDQKSNENKEEIDDSDIEDPDQAIVYQKYASEITKDHYYMFIDFLKYKGVKVMIAPYEADSQLAYLYRIKEIDYILTEDSDLVAYGCFDIIRRLKKNGECLVLNTKCQLQKKLSPTVRNFLDMDESDRVQCCILAGCDYLPNVKGLAFGSLVRIISNGYDLIESIKAHINKNKLFTKSETNAYIKKFQLAITAFTEQVVFCPISQNLVNLSAYNSRKKTRIILKILNEQYVGKSIKNITKFVNGELDVDNPSKKRKPVNLDFKRLVKFFEYKPDASSGRIGNLTTELVTFDNFDEGSKGYDNKYKAYDSLLRKRGKMDVKKENKRKVETCTNTTRSSPNMSINSKLSFTNGRRSKYNGL